MTGQGRRKIDFGGRSWSAFPDDHWLDFAGNPNFPDYLRIVFVAYGRRHANGHARLRQGELARYLVRKNGTMPDRKNVRHSIDHAVDLGYLMPESRMLCLVVSGSHAQGGSGGADQRCGRSHATPRQTPKDVTGSRRLARKDVNGSSRFDPKDVTGSRRFSTSPLSSPSSPEPHEESA